MIEGSSEDENFDHYPIVDLDSDDNQQEISSEEDDDAGILLHGTPTQRRRLIRRSLDPAAQRDLDVTSSEDEFEKEMEAELVQTVTSLESRLKTGVNLASASTFKPSDEFYAREYFDSSSDEEGTSTEKASRRKPRLTNEELFYDPDQDEADQRWVDAQRTRCQPITGRAQRSANQRAARGGASKRKAEHEMKLPNSDAVLNCPACMCLLCRDCQRHSVYKQQYRAMFVTNCEVDTSETLKYPLRGARGRPGGQSGDQAGVQLSKRQLKKQRTKERKNAKLRHGQAASNEKAVDQNQIQNEQSMENMDLECTKKEHLNESNKPEGTKSLDDNHSDHVAQETSHVKMEKTNGAKTDLERGEPMGGKGSETVNQGSPPKQSKLVNSENENLTDNGELGKTDEQINDNNDVTMHGNDVTMHSGATEESRDYDEYNPVKCTQCSTVVGVIDAEMIVHFFNVLASY